ncbi:MAG: hypothetical protein ACYS30_11615 [Planctomycetota bacterium]|jgi:hypothetical protein
MSEAEKMNPREDEGLIALYQETWGEITRLRDYEWKIAYYFSSLSGGLIVLVFSLSLQCALTVWLRCALTGFQVAATIFAIYYLETTHRQLTLQRNIRRSIEELFGFCDPGVWRKKAILPEEWKGKQISSSFQRMGLLVPLMVMVLLAQMLSIFVIWKVN